jgi:hypothetical protein
MFADCAFINRTGLIYFRISAGCTGTACSRVFGVQTHGRFAPEFVNSYHNRYDLYLTTWGVQC